MRFGTLLSGEDFSVVAALLNLPWKQTTTNIYYLYFYVIFIVTFWHDVFSGNSTKTLQRAWEVSRPANEKPHTDVSVFASHLHQHQCDQSLLPWNTRQTYSIRLENSSTLLNAHLCTHMENFTTMGQYYVTGYVLDSSSLWAFMKALVMADQT